MSVRRRAKLPWALVLLLIGTAASAQSLSEPKVPAPSMPPQRMQDLPVAPVTVEEEIDPGNHWLDAGHRNLHAMLWRSAMHVDRWFGGDWPAHTYADQTRGSITPVVLWDEHNGFDEKFRFRVNMPLPYLGERFDAFLGTFTRDEFVTEREQPSGAIPRQRAGGRVDEDQTLIGIRYRDRDRDRIEAPGSGFQADVGLRIRSPLDPFVKGGYRWIHDTDSGIRTVLRETVFWQNSEKFGLTSRVDFERMFENRWFARFTTSGTISQRSEGVQGYMAVTMYRPLSDERSIAAQLFTTAEFDADVPLEEFGVRAAFRKRIAREWLVLELRPSVTWPKDDDDQPRKPSWGLGIGFEMYFGMDEFQSRPVTF